MAQIGIGSATITDGTTYVTDAAYSRWKVSKEGGMAVLYTGVVDPTDTDAAVLSPGIPGILANNRKIAVGFNTTTAGANVTSDFGIQGSLDGKNWILAVSELDADVTPDVTGLQTYSADLSDIYYAWYRLIWNDGLLDNTTWAGTFHVTGLAGGGNVELLGIGGVGEDPS
jgi:hypothetical protein